jgi:hypothetical protein
MKKSCAVCKISFRVREKEMLGRHFCKKCIEALTKSEDKNGK